MRKMLVAFFVVLSFVFYSYADQQEERIDEPLYQQLARAIIRLENNERKPVGTAFFTTYDGDSKHYYLITARHVVFPPKNLLARVPSQRLDTGKTEIIELRIPSDQWIFHPESERQIVVNGKSEKIMPVDIAVAKIPGIKNRRVRTIGYCPVKCSSDKKENQFLEKDPDPPMRVLVWGFPVDLGFTLEEQRPLGRLGLVAMKAKEPFIRTDGLLRDERVFLLDAPIFPGNSGSPVLSYPAIGKIKLAGLVSAINITLNYAIAEPVSRISETMDEAFRSNTVIKSGWYLIEKSEKGGRP